MYGILTFVVIVGLICANKHGTQVAFLVGR